MHYPRWNTGQDIPLLLALVNPDGSPATGKLPLVQIRRYRETHGGDLDLYCWDGAGFVASVVSFILSEVPGYPGVYQYVFEQSLVGLQHQYLVYYRSTDPEGFAQEVHTVTDEVYVPITQPDPIVIGPDSLMGQLELIKDGGTATFNPATDNLRTTAESALRALGLLHHNAMVDRQIFTADGQLSSARVRVFDSASAVPATPGGNETAGLLHEYAIDSTYQDGLVNQFSLRRVL